MLDRSVTEAAVSSLPLLRRWPFLLEPLALEVLPFQGSSPSASYQVLPVSYQVCRGLKGPLENPGKLGAQELPILGFIPPLALLLLRP